MRLRPGTPEEAGMSTERVRRLATLAEQAVTDGMTSALVVLVARRGVIVVHEALGHLRPDDATPLPRDAIYPIMSITKPIVATAVMTLVEDGLLGLNRPVAEYIPEFAGAGNEAKGAVMVHHLLTHTSGLTNEDVRAHGARLGLAAPLAPGEVDFPPVDVQLRMACEAPLSRAPGVEMSYCNQGYELLGEIVRRVGGCPLGEFAAERIFEPLGMGDTSFGVPQSRSHRFVQLPAVAPHAEALNDRNLQERQVAAGGVTSTALDLAIFGQMFLNRGRYGDTRILGPAAVTEMTRNQIPGTPARFLQEVFPEAAWGLGWNVSHPMKRAPYSGALHSGQQISHQGLGGVYLWIDPAQELVGVYFSTVLDRLPNGFARSNRDLFMSAASAAIVDP